MIIDIVAKLVFWVMDVVLDLMPDWNLPNFVVAGFSEFSSVFVSLTHLVPFLTAFFNSFALLVIFHFSIKLGNIIFGSLALIRGSGKPEL